MLLKQKNTKVNRYEPKAFRFVFAWSISGDSVYKGLELRYIIFRKTKQLTLQVVVTINDIPSSCRGRACDFNYTLEKTPQLILITPKESVSDSPVTLLCENCSSQKDNLKVSIGGTPCEVISATPSGVDQVSVVCKLGKRFYVPHQGVNRVRIFFSKYAKYL